MTHGTSQYTIFERIALQTMDIAFFTGHSELKTYQVGRPTIWTMYFAGAHDRRFAVS